MKELPNKQDCYYVIEMLESSLIDYRYTHPWAHNIIESSESPPSWRVDVSLNSYRGDQISAILEYVNSEPREDCPSDLEKFYIACLWLRYERRELSWATFLREAGEYLDAVNGDWHCETPYHYLNLHEDAHFSEASEKATKSQYLEEQNLLPWIRSAKEKMQWFR